MKKEIGKWLLDIAKYVVTAVLISTWFSGIENWTWQSKLYVVLFVVALFCFGLSFIHGSEKKTTQKKSNQKKSKKR